MRARYSLMETGTLAWRSSRKKFTNIVYLPVMPSEARHLSWPRSFATLRMTTSSSLALLPPRHERKTFEQMDVLLVLQQGAVQRWDQLLGVLGPQCLGRHLLDHQALQPVEQLGGRGLLLQARHFADVIKDVQRLAQQVALQIGEMNVDDLGHDLAIGEADVVEEAAAQESVGQLFLVVGGDHDDRPLARLHHFLRLVDVELHAIELEQEVVGELDVSLVDLVDQQD